MENKNPDFSSTAIFLISLQTYIIVAIMIKGGDSLAGFTVGERLMRTYAVYGGMFCIIVAMAFLLSVLVSLIPAIRTRHHAATVRRLGFRCGLALAAFQLYLEWYASVYI